MPSKTARHPAPHPKMPMAGPLKTAVNLPRLLPLDVVDADPTALNDKDGTFLVAIISAVQRKDTDGAIALALEHLNKNPRNAAVLNLTGALYLQKRDHQNAEKYLMQAGRIDPSSTRIINNQACAHILRKSYKTAETILRAGTTRLPDQLFAQYLYNMALCLAFQGQTEEAELTLTRSMKQEPFVESYILACRLAYSRGDLESAHKILGAGQERFPRSALIRYYQAGLALMQADITRAVEHICPAFRMAPDHPHIGMLYATVMNNLKFEEYNPNQADLISLALQNPAVSTSYLSQAWQSLFANAPIWQDAVQKGTAITIDDANTLINQLKTENALTPPFIMQALRRMIMKGHFAERIFTILRHAYLTRAVNAPDTLDKTDLDFMSGLASQCYFNEYVYYITPEEHALYAALRTRLDPRTPALPDLLALCCYSPILSVLTKEQAEAQRGSPLVAPLVKYQVDDVQVERDLMEQLPRLTPIHDSISLAVEQMYLENPYPAWLSTQYCGDPEFLNLSLDINKRHHLLIAGCGTGQHAIMSALNYENVQVLAIDLSRRSLAYAWRKTRALGLIHVTYAQADILELKNIGQTFDSIESVGVLHHLSEPEKGLKILVDLLRPGGLMKLGLYSETARAAMVAGRDEVARLGLTGTIDDIRRLRHDILMNPDTHPARNILKNGDFYTTSTCRDLLFHVQEHRYTLPMIQVMLANHGLIFEEFNLDFPTTNKFRKLFPREEDLKNLDLWNQFEQQNPETFVNMYQFSVRKPIMGGSKTTII